MSRLAWDTLGERFYETGVDRGVLYIPDSGGVYNDGVAWNGLTTITEAPSGAAATPQFADNIKYLNLISAEEFGGTINAFTYPDEFAQYDGLESPSPGLSIGQQARKSFGLCYRTRLGNDLDGEDHGYKLHLVYGCQVAPSQKAFGTINATPAPIDFSWTLTTTPVNVTNYKPTSLVIVDSTKVTAGDLSALEDILYGTAGIDPRLPLPDELIAMFAGAVTVVPALNVPTYDGATHVVTIPTQTGITYYIDDVALAAGPQPPLSVGESVIVTAQPDPGYTIAAGNDNDWEFTY